MSDPNPDPLPLGVLPYQPPTRTCKACGKRKPLDQFPGQERRGKRIYARRCIECRNALRRSKWADLTPEEKRAVGHKVHGRPLTPEEFAAKAASQGGACAICGDVPKPHPSGRPRADGTRATETGLTYDHDHVTGIGRDLLCHHCNTMIGMAREDPARLLAAAAYVQRWATR